MINHVLQRFGRRGRPAAAFPPKKQSNPRRKSQKLFFNHSHSVPYCAEMESLNLNPHTRFSTARAIRCQFVPIMNSIELDRFPARFVVKAFVVRVKTDRD